MKQNMDTPHILLLGAGASVESGIPSAMDCIWDWKKEIFLSQNPALVETYNNIKLDSVRFAIQKWLDAQKVYPVLNSNEEYSFYAENTYPIPDDRRKYFEHLIDGKKPSLGYHLISMLAEKEIFKSIWTTNFDGLMVKCAHQYNIVPIEITLESVERIYRNDTKGELMCIALHGDYKYGELKNTTEELDTQNEIFLQAISHELTDHDLIVLGYSGRDKSLMSALKTAYQIKGVGKLFWCGYGDNPNNEVRDLIRCVNELGRVAYYVSTDGFDKTMYSLARHCMSDDKIFVQNIEKLKQNLGSEISLSTSDFIYTGKTINKIADTNIFPIVFPKNCFQLQISYSNGEKPWEYCKNLLEKEIMAVPYKDLLYVWGDKEQIQNVCGNRVRSEIAVSPFTRDALIHKSQFKELLIRTLTAMLGQVCSLRYHKDKIWDTTQQISKQIGNKLVIGYKGINLSLLFDNKYTYITLNPTFMIDKDIVLTHEEKKIFADAFNLSINSGKPNYNIHKYIKDWANKLLGVSGVRLSYPLGSKTGFEFVVKRNTAIVGINYGTGKQVELPTTIDKKRIVFNGIESRDPELTFYNSSQNRMVTDFHPMRGLIYNAPFDYLLNEKVLRSSISLGVICPKGYERQFYEFLCQLNCKQNVKYNVDFVIPFPGFSQAFKTGLNIPTPTENKWIEYLPKNTADSRQDSVELGNMLTQRLDQLNAMEVDVALIYIPKEYEFLTGYSEENEKFDLHDFIKAYAAQRNTATQFIREKTIESDMYCQIMWAVSLAIYVKSGRIPWTISGLQQDTAFAGIGYSVNECASGESIVVGCSHIYSSNGQGMKYKLSKIDEVTFDRKKNPFLSENEAFRLGLNIKELFYKSFTELPKRVVIHKRTPFKKEEVKGLTESLVSAGIQDIELLEIAYADDVRCFEYNKYITEADGFPVRRGLCFPLNSNTMYLFTHGIAPSVRNPNYKYIQGGKSIPLPLKIVKYYGNGTMAQIATEILGLSKMNWNSFGLYSKLPCTIESSNEIARIGWLLSQYEGAIYEYRYFM
ncbi:MAG: SIR2 family protein [Bacteroides sp.]|nr:SIR2 family protein [Bacteroides sp.]